MDSQFLLENWKVPVSVFSHMMDSKMNLVTGKWIPIIRSNGQTALASLLDVFTEGDKIADLAVRPHERIALMRLLICIAQASLDGPSDLNEWKDCLSKLPQQVSSYLEKWKGAFELFGDEARFLQVPNVSRCKAGGSDADSSISKLDIQLASGNASTLFDNAGGSFRRFSPDRVALLLLTFQCFSPGGLLSQCIWNGTITKKEGNVAAPCLAGKMVHTFFLDRHSLFRSIWLNLMNKQLLKERQIEWGMPVWEMMPQGPEDTKACTNATKTYLGRLVPLSRVVHLQEDGETMIWGSALDFPSFPEWRDPFATIYLSLDRKGEKTPTLLGGDLNKALWRELHSILAVSHSHEGLVGGPYALSQAAEQHDIDVFCAAMVHAPQRTTKILDVVESVFHLPEPMFSNPGQNLYQEGVQLAEKWANRLGKALTKYRQALKDTAYAGEFSRKKVLLFFWTSVEQELPALLSLIETAFSLRAQDAPTLQWHTSEWGRALARAARYAFDLACPSETPRQMEAYVTALKTLEFYE